MHHSDTTHTRTHTAFESEPQYRFHSSAKKITGLNAKVRDWAADNVHLIDVADLLKTEKDLVVVVNHLCSCYPVVPRNLGQAPSTHPATYSLTFTDACSSLWLAARARTV